MSQKEEKFSIRDFSQNYSLPDAVNTLLTEFQTHVQSMMKEWRNNISNISDPSSIIEPHTRLPPQIRDTLRLAATEATEAWKSIVDSAALCIRDKIFSDDLTELRVDGKTIDERYTEMLKDNNMYNERTQQEVDDLVLGKISTVGKNGQEVQVDASRAIVALGVEPTRQVVQGIFDANQELDGKRTQKRIQVISSSGVDSAQQTKLDAESLQHVLALAWDMDKAYGGNHHLKVERPQFEFDDVDPWSIPSYDDCGSTAVSSSDEEEDGVEVIYDVVTIPVLEQSTITVDEFEDP